MKCFKTWINNHDESMVKLSKECMTNSNFKNFSSNFQIPQTSFDKKLPPLMVRANISNDLMCSSVASSLNPGYGHLFADGKIDKSHL
jgi:hypothetical protein